VQRGHGVPVRQRHHDQLLWEVRGPSGSTGETAGPSDAYGTVSYTNGGGIDRPLVITKGSTSILPHQNWRGQFSRGTYATGASSDCPAGVTTGARPSSGRGGARRRDTT
jgi:hypothetical protein